MAVHPHGVSPKRHSKKISACNLRAALQINLQIKPGYKANHHCILTSSKSEGHPHKSQASSSPWQRGKHILFGGTNWSLIGSPNFSRSVSPSLRLLLTLWEKKLFYFMYFLFFIFVILYKYPNQNWEYFVLYLTNRPWKCTRRKKIHFYGQK